MSLLLCRLTKNILLFLVIFLCMGKCFGYAAQSVCSVAADGTDYMSLHDVRQYYVKNKIVGDLFVIEGLIVNEAATPQKDIQVSAELYDAKKVTIASTTREAGTKLSVEQLTTLDKSAIENLLLDAKEIQKNNNYVPVSKGVPFMVVFYNPKSNVFEFGLKVSSTKNAENK